MERRMNEYAELQSEIARQEAQIEELEQLAQEKRDEIQRITQEYETTASDLKAGIHYAERIQRAVIPTDTEFKALFGDCFVYFVPRDIVSGDFYTYAASSDCKIAVVADCTGHGVPGGLLSMLGLSALKDLLSENVISMDLNPGEILDSLRKFVLTSLAESDESDGTTVRDGMDFTLCIFDNGMTHMRFATANHTIYVARNGEIIKLKGSRTPIGRHPKQDEPFESFTFDLQPDDMVYLCSDGIQDQFGGADDVKFTTRRLAEMLLDQSVNDTRTQLANISKIVDDWQAGRMQYDDQTLIGIRI